MNYYWILVRINVLTTPPKKIKNEKGWCGHPVCRKRYHLIIRAANGSGSLDDGYQDHNKSCSSCGAQLHLSESRYLPLLFQNIVQSHSGRRIKCLPEDRGRHAREQSGHAFLLDNTHADGDRTHLRRHGGERRRRHVDGSRSRKRRRVES